MRKLFGTDGVRGEFGKFPLDLETINKLGKSIATYFEKGKCLIGRDTRESSSLLEKELVKGLISRGIDVYLLGVAPTSAISLLVKEMELDFGIMISASHNPYQDNGIKIFNQQGFKLNDQEEEKIESFFDSEHLFLEEGDVFEIKDKLKIYSDFVKNNSPDLTGIKIILDCANGSAFEIAPKILFDLGAEVITFYNSPNGQNINCGCGATHPEAIQTKIKETNADLGIVLDGDADRLILIDDQGEILDGDHILAIIGRYFQEKGVLQDKLVSTVMANFGLVQALEKQGIELIKTKVGDRYVLQEMLRQNIPIGGEQSGHILFLNYINSGDGLFSALQVLKVVKEKGKKLSQLKLIMKKFPQILINIEVKEKKNLKEIEKINLKIKELEDSLGNGSRVLLRYSGTQNLLRVMIEGEDESLVKKYAEELVQVIEQEIGAGNMEEKLPENIEEISTNASGIKFSIKKEGQEVAFGFLYLMHNVKEKPFGLMEYIFVKEEYRGQGLGTQIVKAIIKSAKEHHCYKLIGTSRTHREKVHQLYLRLGFKDWGKEFRMNFD